MVSTHDARANEPDSKCQVILAMAVELPNAPRIADAGIRPLEPLFMIRLHRICGLLQSSQKVLRRV